MVFLSRREKAEQVRCRNTLVRNGGLHFNMIDFKVKRKCDTSV